MRDQNEEVREWFEKPGAPPRTQRRIIGPIVGPIKRRLSRKARRAVRHSEVAAIDSDLRRQGYLTQNRVHGATRTGTDGLTPAQRRRIRHKENAGRSHG
jgi:hypothetical protein